MTLGPEPPLSGGWNGVALCEAVVSGICQGTKLSSVEVRLHNPEIGGTGSGIKGHPKAFQKNPGHHGLDHRETWSSEQGRVTQLEEH